MHATTFALKRAHWSGVAFGREVVAEIDHMTPARFDFLFCVRRGMAWVFEQGKNGILQRDLRRELGVHAMTVSKMAARLEELGWIERERYVGDGRINLIWLTAKGEEVMRRAEEVVFGGRKHEELFLTSFQEWAEREWYEVEPPPPGTTEKPAVQLVWEYTDRTREIARQLGDDSRLEYDLGWEPVEVEEDYEETARMARMRVERAEIRIALIEHGMPFH